MPYLLIGFMQFEWQIPFHEGFLQDNGVMKEPSKGQRVLNCSLLRAHYGSSLIVFNPSVVSTKKEDQIISTIKIARNGPDFELLLNIPNDEIPFIYCCTSLLRSPVESSFVQHEFNST